MLVPRFLEASIESFTRDQEKFRQQLTQTFGTGPFGTSPFVPLEEQVRRNMEMFERAFSMFTPFPRREAPGGETYKASESPPPAETQKPAPEPADEIHDLKRQLEDVQKRLNKLSEGKG
jgi:polyhydroxyalkanoate synthesis regulator protein